MIEEREGEPDIDLNTPTVSVQGRSKRISYPLLVHLNTPTVSVQALYSKGERYTRELFKYTNCIGSSLEQWTYYKLETHLNKPTVSVQVHQLLACRFFSRI